MSDLDNTFTRLIAFMKPSSVAVIGASAREDSVGYAVFANILKTGFKGIVYPVNPSTRSILGVRCYSSVLEIPDPVDLAVICIPSKFVPQCIIDCGKKDVKGVVVISAGFKETGAEGAKLEEALKEAANSYNLPLVGPNCLGLGNMDPNVQLNATFAKRVPRAGNIAIVSQSGALGVSLMDYASSRNIGISKVVSLGNKAVLNELDLLKALASDPLTKVILLYLEDLVDGRGFIETVRTVTDTIGKPILALKAGRTAAGAKAASSHTGSLAGSDEVYDAIFLQSGVLRVEFTAELFDYAIAFARQRLPKSNRIGIITNAGGPGILTTDACIRYEMSIPTLMPETITALKSFLPAAAALNNPIDIIGDADENRYEKTLGVMIKDPSIDSLIVIATRQFMTDTKAIAEAIARAASQTDKTIMVSFPGAPPDDEGVVYLEENNVPVYQFSESAVRALAMMQKYESWVLRRRTEVKTFKDVDRAKAQSIIDAVTKEKREVLTEPEAYDVLEAYRFDVPRHYLAKNVEEAIKAAQEVGYPVVMKIVSPDIIHKMDVGGVKVGIQDASALRQSYEEMIKAVNAAAPNAKVWGVGIYEMVKGGIETILGVKRDPQFGPIIVFGTGGTAVELYKDVSFRLAPIRELGAYNMISSTRASQLLAGYRGSKKGDITKLEENLERLSQMACELQEISELDINPLVVLEDGKGCKALDARILIKPPMQKRPC
ncbi:MAG: acetate--CoA ligase family protein [Conexivisphaerales archaeon]|jgi:acetyltransferase